MKNVVLALVLVNLGFAAWFFWIADEPEQPSDTRSANVPGITLVGEIQNQPADPAITETSPIAALVEPEPIADEPAVIGVPVVAEPVVIDAPVDDEPVVEVSELRCISLGPFSQLLRFEEAVDALSSQGYEPQRRDEVGEVWLGFWILLPNVFSQEQAGAISADLAEGGFDDTYFDPTGADGDVLSLGLYREIERAELVRDQVASLGFAPEITDRTRPGTVHWIDLALDDEPEPEVQPLQPAGTSIRLEERICESPGEDETDLSEAA